MKTLVTATIFAVLLCSIHCEPFTVKVFTRSEYEVGADVVCEIAIINNQNKDYFLLTRDTPLEGLRSDIFSIAKDRNPISYDGFFFKRGPPVEEEYMLIKANSSIRSSVDLTSAYAFDTAGTYTVKLYTTLQFAENKFSDSHLQQVSSNIREFQLTGSEKQPRLTTAEFLRRNTTKILKFRTNGVQAARYPAFAGRGTKSDESTGTTAYLAAYSVLTKCYRSVDSNPSLYSKWFGSTYYKNTVKGVYLDIKGAMERYTYTLYFHGEKCSPGVVAYTHHGASVVYLCDGYFSAPTSGTDSKMGTIVHEMSHAVAYTEDIAYGQRDCQILASSKPSEAVNNADNYEYFAESQ